MVWNMLLALKAFDPSDAKRTRHRPEEANIARHPVHASSVQYLLVVNICLLSMPVIAINTNASTFTLSWPGLNVPSMAHDSHILNAHT